MKFSSVALALAASLPVTSAVRNGFNMGSNTESGGCRSENDWFHAFKTMKGLPGKFDQVRLYSSSTCGTLHKAVPAAKRAGVKILVGIWAEPPAHYAMEKKALVAACDAHGTKWISSISVGSEDLYRNDTTPGELSMQVEDVRGMMKGFKGGRKIPIGHVDTYTEWIKPDAKGLIKAVDFVGVDAYPYYQGAKIERAHGVFHKALDKTKRAAGKKPVWVTESGWPITGATDGQAVPSAANAQHYWKKTMCGLFKSHNTFYYTMKDYWVTPNLNEPSFGVIGSTNKHVFDLKC